MAKELPYFKFEPQAWDTGNIQMCSRESKGLFVDLCSLYWSRLGELPYALALQKLCNGNEYAFEELIKRQIFGVIDDNIVIEFLDEQLAERDLVSEERRKAAKKRWDDANALQLESKGNARREEEKREEEKKGEKKKAVPVPFVNGTLVAWNDWVEHRKQARKPLTPKAIEKQIKFLQKGGRGDPEIILILETAIEKNWQGLYEIKTYRNVRTQEPIRTVDAIIPTNKSFGAKEGFPTH